MDSRVNVVNAMNSRGEPSARNSAQVAVSNRQAVLDTIRRHEPIARPEIARLTGLTSATVANIVSDLIKQDIVHEAGLGKSAGGRKPKLIAIVKDSRLVIAVDLAGADKVAALVDVDGRIIRRGSVRLSKGGEVAVENVIASVSEVLNAPEARRSRIVGIGATTPGLVDRDTGTVLKSVGLNWFNVPIRQILQNHFDYPVFVGKDTHVGLMAEEWYGAAKNVRNAIYVWIGPGIAIGIMLDGRLYTGTTGMAGEFGHTSIDQHGDQCKCGSQGCIERLASFDTIKHLAGSAGLASDPFAILDAAEAGDPKAFGAVQQMGESLGIGVANLINIFNPDLIILGGQIRPCDRKLVDVVKRTAIARSLTEVGSAVTITVSEYGRDAGLVGASALVWQQEFGSLAHAL